MRNLSDDSREKMLAQLERCMYGQRNQHLITPPDVPRADDWVPGSTECIAEEPMGNGQPLVHCDTEHPSSIANPYEGSWA